jgi:tetratricopeptide (TPR) repeat protein
MRRWVLISIIVLVLGAAGGAVAWYVHRQSGSRLLAAAEVALTAKQYDKAQALGASYAAKYPDDWRGYHMQVRALNFKGRFIDSRELIARMPTPADDTGKSVMQYLLADTYAWPARQSLSTPENLKIPSVLATAIELLQQANELLLKAPAASPRSQLDAAEYRGINARIIAIASRRMADHYSRLSDAAAKASRPQQQQEQQQTADQFIKQADQYEQQAIEVLLDVIRHDASRDTASRWLAELCVDRNDPALLKRAKEAIFDAEDPSPEAAVLLLAQELRVVMEGDPLVRETQVAAIAERIERVHARHPENASAAVARAELALARNDSTTALALCDKVLAAAPRHLQARLVRARALTAKGQKAQAERELFALKTDWANSSRAHLEYGLSALANGRRELAREAFHEVLRLAPKDVEARRQLGIMLIEDGVISESYAQAAELYALAPADRGALAMFVETAIRYDRAQQAREALVKTQADFPDRPDMLMAVYDGYVRLNDQAAAQKALSQAAACTPRQGYTTELAAIARACVGLGRSAQAERLLLDELQRVPDKHRVHFELGGMFLSTARPLQAVAHLRSALKEKPDSNTYQLALATALIAVGQLDEAQELAQSAIALGQPARNLLLQIRVLRGTPEELAAGVEVQASSGLSLASSLLNNGQPQRCVDVCQAHLKTGRDETAARTLLAQAYVAMGQRDKAADELERLIAANPDDWTAYARLAAVLAPTARVEEIAQRLRRPVNARWDMVEITLAQLLLGLGRLSEADTALSALLARADLPAAIQGQARIVHAQALYNLKQTDKALSQLAPLLDTSTWGPQALVLSGDMLLATRQYAQADAILIRARQRAREQDEPALLRRVASLYAQWRQYDKALEAAAELVTLRPTEAGSYVAAADISRAAGKLEDAVTLYRKAIENAPAHASTYLLLAATLDTAQRRPEALAALDELETLGQSEKAIALFERGQMLSRWGLAQQAMEAFRQLADSGMSTHPRVQLALGDAMARVGEVQAAKDMLGAVPTYAPQYIPAQQRLAALAQDTGERLEILRRLRRSAPGQTEILKQEMDVLLKADRADEALAAWRQYVESRGGGALAGDAAAMAVGVFVAAGDSAGALDLARQMTTQTRIQPWRELAALLCAREQPAAAIKLLGDASDATPQGAIAGLVAASASGDNAAAWAAACSPPSTQPSQPGAADPAAQLLVALVQRRYDQADALASQMPESGAMLRPAAAELARHARTDGGAEARTLALALAAARADQHIIARTLAGAALDARPQCQWAAAMALMLEDRPQHMKRIVRKLQPDDTAQALMLRAVVSMEEHDLAAAAELYGKAADADAGNVSLRLKQAQCLDLCGKFEDALALYRGIYQSTLRPDAANAVAYLTAMLWPQDQQKLEQARKLVEEALSHSDVGAWRDTRGWIAFLQNNCDQACQDLRAASDEMRSSPELHYHLGSAELAAGRASLARWHLAAAVHLAKAIKDRGQYVSPGQQSAADQARQTLERLGS